MADTLQDYLAEWLRQQGGYADPGIAAAPLFRSTNEKDPTGAAVVRAADYGPSVADAVAASPWTKAQTIGAPGLGEHYVPASVGELLASDNPARLLAEYVVGHGRPQSVAAADPYGIEAWRQGVGPMPAFIGSTEDVGGIRAYHGSPHDFERFQMPSNAREPAVFLSSSEAEALEFGRMKTGGKAPYMYEAAIPGEAVHTVNYADYSPGGDPLYEPDTMERILADAKAQRAKAVRIQGVQNFEHGTPTDTYAILDPSLIKTLRKYGFLPPSVGLGYLLRDNSAPEAR